jgi:Xaa-Pro dipeptidase
MSDLANSTAKSSLRTRHNKLSTKLQLDGLDALILNPGPSLTYLSGLHFHISERPIVVLFRPNQTPIIVLPELEAAKVSLFPFDVKVFTYGENPASWTESFRQAFIDAKVEKGQIGFEPRALRLLEYQYLVDAAPEAKFINAEASIAALRMYKYENEITAMRNAVDIAQESLLATLPLINIGMTERQVASELTSQLLKHGSNPRLPFFPIVASGPNSANPHATPTDRLLSPGDLLVIDFGANVDGYYSDITRTFAVGDVSEEFENIARIVAQSNAAGRVAAGPGVLAGDIDRASRSVIVDGGYGKYFIHRTGHGLGLEGHEEPYIRDDNPNPLEPGMTFTIEPGIYLPNLGGVRIEDDMLITPSGAESLTDLPRHLVSIGT